MQYDWCPMRRRDLAQRLACAEGRDGKTKGGCPVKMDVEIGVPS